MSGADGASKAGSFDASGGRYVVAGVCVILGALGGVGGWAGFTSLAGAVPASGTLNVLSRRKTVQHLEGGIVAGIAVQEGDRVEAGQPLLTLDDTRERADLSIVETSLLELRARALRLLAERDGATELGGDAAGFETAGGPRWRVALAGERELFQARRRAFEGEIALQRQRQERLREEIRGLRGQFAARMRQKDLIAEELTSWRILLENGYVARSQVLALERAMEELRGQRAGYLSSIARAEQAIIEVELEIGQRERAFEESVIESLRDVQSRIAEREQQLESAADRLRRLTIRAPEAGRIVGLAVHTVGGVIQPGAALLDIVPLGDELVVDAQIAPRHVDKITRGQTATVRLSAFEREATPLLQGIVLNVSADRLLDDSTGVPHYAVRIAIEPARRELDDGLELVPGMPADVFIDTGERSPISYLMKPLSDALARSLTED